MKFESLSQAGQDKFAYERIGNSGTFLDIGCGDQNGSNTLALERIGWTGTLVELNSKRAAWCRKNRRGILVEGDATKMDWKLLSWTGREFDYLSLDIDDTKGEPSKIVQVLTSLLDAGFMFRVMTIEHDRYRIGDETRNQVRDICIAHGYKLAVGDVAHKGNEFEDWWIEETL